MAPKTGSSTKTKAVKAVPIDQAMRDYVDLLVSNKKGPANYVFKDTLNGENKLRATISVLDHLVTALKAAGEGERLNNDKQISKDLSLWDKKIIEHLKNADYQTKMRFMDKIMSAGFLPSTTLSESLLAMSSSQLDKMDKNQLMRSLIFITYMGQDNSDFLGRWEGRYNELREANESEFTFRDAADLAYCCGEMRLELRDNFITGMCDRLNISSVTDGNISQDDAVRALHGLAMLDCIYPDHHADFLKIAEISLNLIQSPEDLSAENQRILLTSCAWLDLDTECSTPEIRAQSSNNQALRDKFVAYAHEPDNHKPALPSQKYKSRFKKLKGGKKVEISVDVEPPCVIPQKNDAIAARLGFAAAVTADIEVPIHIMTDDESDILHSTSITSLYNLKGEKVGEKGGFLLKGHAFLESKVIAKLTNGPVLHFKDNETTRLIRAKNEKFSDAFGEYTWPVFDNELTGGVYLVSKQKGEIQYLPA